MNQEVEQEGAASSSRAGWGRRSRRDDLTGYDDFEQFNDAASTEDASAGISMSEYRRTNAPPLKGACTSYGGSGAPCGACKFLRRKCANDCVFAPYFRAEHGAARFAAVHKIFGASNVGKLLQSIPVQKREHAVETISYEAQARITNPVYGCVAAIAALQQQVQSLQAELSFVHAQLANSRQLAAVMALQQQGVHGGPFLPFEQSQPSDPIHMQQVLCHQISSPITTLSYNNRVKEEIENPLHGIVHLYDSLPVGNPPTPSITVDHMQPDMESHHHHLSLDLTEKNDDVPSQSSTDAAHLHALIHTRNLNLHEIA